MDQEYWRDRWNNGHIGFHESEPNPGLTAHFHRLHAQPDQRILVPLCGKSLDIRWFLSQQCRVVGVELSERAVSDLWSELGLSPRVSHGGPLVHFHAPGLDVFQGDIFALTRAQLGPVDAIYDRAALVALPPEMRRRYATHLVEISGGAPQLLLCYVYDQQVYPGPPFSVPDQEIRALYSDTYSLSLIESNDLSGGLKGEYPAKEQVWLLQRPSPLFP